MATSTTYAASQTYGSLVIPAGTVNHPPHRLDPAKFVVRYNGNVKNVDVSVDGLTVLRNTYSNALLARILSGSLGTGYSYANRLNFSSVNLDEAGGYNDTNKEFTVPASGKYDVAAQIMIDATAGEQVRLGILLDGSFVGGAETYRKASGGVETFRVERRAWVLAKGTKISVAGSVAATAAAFSGGATGSSVCTNFLEITQL